jgi:hypothetical protein
MDIDKINEIVNRLVIEFTNKGNVDIKGDSLVGLATRLMETVDKENVKGREKKEVIMNVLRNIINLHAKEEDKISLNMILDNVIPSMIDVVIDASKGKLDIHKVVKATTSCIGWCVNKKSTSMNNRI